MWSSFLWLGLFSLCAASLSTTQILHFHGDEDPVLEGIERYPIILVINSNLENGSYVCSRIDCLNCDHKKDIIHKTVLTDLNGTMLRVSILDYQPLVNLEMTNVSGYFVDVVEILAKLMNFHIVYQKPSDCSWGSKKKDGTWSGMVGELLNNASDIAIGGLTITQERSKVIDFAHGLFNDEMALNYRRPEQAEFEFLAFVKVFKRNTWIGNGIALIIMGLGLYLASHMGSNKIGLLRSCEFTWVNFILKDPKDHDHLNNPSSTLSFKLFCLVISLFSLMVMTVYTGDLTSQMTASGKVNDLTSFQGKLFVLHCYKAKYLYVSYLRQSP